MARTFTPLHGPLACLITFRCYGTWLHGDARGSVDREHNTYGTPLVEPDDTRERHERRLLKYPLMALNAECRAVVERTIREVADHRGWVVHCVQARTNHVHIVATVDTSVERAMTSLKAWCTRRLVEAGLVAAGVKPWERHGSTRYLWTQKDIEEACEYVVEGQGEELPLHEV